MCAAISATDRDTAPDTHLLNAFAPAHAGASPCSLNLPCNARHRLGFFKEGVGKAYDVAFKLDACSLLVCAINQGR